MKAKRTVAITLLICAAAIFIYWIGYQHGRASSGKMVSLSNTDKMPGVERNDPIEPAPQIPRQQDVPKQPVIIPPRDPAAKAVLIDLSSWYNAGLTGKWHGGQPGNDFGAIGEGVHIFAGTEFDVRGLVQLRGSDPGSAPYPRRLVGIPLGLRCHKLHFLHNALFGRLVPRSQTIGAYVLHYADGESVTVPLRIGENILDWWGTPTELPPNGTTVAAWQGTNHLSAKQGKRIHLNKFSWENPRPDVELVALDFVSEVRTSAPFLVAVTAEP